MKIDRKIEKSGDEQSEDTRIRDCVASVARVRDEIAKVIVGQNQVVELCLIALLCEGHVLLEGVPGLGKTMLVKALSDALSLKFSRIQFTPDLMPSDVIGNTLVLQSAGDFRLSFEPGPVFANLVLADEINRASPKTQSALLEAMQERAATVRGERHPMPRPFQVLATQNPLEMEGTYALPEAQLDRFFFKLRVEHPSEAELIDIVGRTVGQRSDAVSPVMSAEDLAVLQTTVRDVVIPDHIVALAARTVLATQPGNAYAGEKVARFIRYGAGPRAAQALSLAAKARALMQGRFHVSMDDFRFVLVPALRHRLALNFEGHAEGLDIDALIPELMKSVEDDRAIPRVFAEQT